MAPVPRLAGRRRARRPRARRGHRNRSRRPRARSAEGLLGRRRRPEPADARGGAPARERAHRARGGERRALPFEDGEFDALTFTYLLRYVEDPAATLAELARVVRPGATVAGLEFGLPHGIWRPLWELHVRVALPGRGRRGPERLARGRVVPRALDPRLLVELAARAPARRLARRRDRRRHFEAPLGRRRDRDMGTRRGKARVLRPADGRMAGLRHARPPALHGVEPRLRRDRRSARAASSAPTGCSGRWPPSRSPSESPPTRSTSSTAARSGRDPRPRARRARRVSLAGACAIGIWAASAWGWGLLAFVAVGAFLVPAYNLEWFGGLFHNTWGLALAWAAFPVLTAFYAEAVTIRAEAILAAGFASLLIVVQRTLSTPVRHARRTVGDARGGRADGARAPHPSLGGRPARRRARDRAPNLDPA